MSTLKLTLNVCSNFLLIEITLRYRRRLSRRSLRYINSDKDTRRHRLIYLSTFQAFANNEPRATDRMPIQRISLQSDAGGGDPRGRRNPKRNISIRSDQSRNGCRWKAATFARNRIRVWGFRSKTLDASRITRRVSRNPPATLRPPPPAGL